MDDDPPVFDTPGEAWAYLVEERKHSEDSVEYDDSDGSEYTDTVQALEAYAVTDHGADVLYGDTPGYDGDHDLGLAYSVSVVEGTPGDNASWKS